MKQRLLVSLLLLSLAEIGQSAQAAEKELGDNVRLSGFGTLGVSQSNNHEADYRANIEQSIGVGRTHPRDSGLDSVLAVQADIDIMPKLTGTVQAVTRRMSRYEATRPYLEWANVKYDVDEQTYVRAGRFVSPTFMISESRMVGLSQLTVRPVAEVYLLSPITYMNGIDGGRKFLFGDTLVKARAGFGNLNQSITQINGTLNFKFSIKSFDVSAEHEGSTFRVGYQKIKMNVTSPGIELYDQAMNTLVAGNVTNAARVQDLMQHDNVPIDFYVLGYAYDKGPWVVQAEYAYRKFSTDFVQSLAGAYVLGGYRIGKWTPYVAASRLMHKSDVNLPSLDSSGAGGLSAVVDAVNAGSALKIHRHATTLGVRYDLKDNVALKFQYDRVVKPADSHAEFVNDTTDFFSSKRKINLLSATLDFTF